MTASTPISQDTNLACFHCGEISPSDAIRIDEKIFCCEGYKIVYEILSESMGILFILRGSNLGIPYVSPKMVSPQVPTEIDYGSPSGKLNSK